MRGLQGFFIGVLQMIPRLSTHYLTEITSFCPCDDCHYSKHCKHECSWFKGYVNTGSSENRRKQLIQFKADQDSLRKTA